MVKGISKQVIVVRSPEPELFEQAIFILTEKALKRQEITDQELLKEANVLLHQRRKRHIWGYGAFWAGLGAGLTGLVWLMTVLI